jgi:hypothetical protein
MAYREAMTMFPAMFGDVVKTRLDPQVAPTFDQDFVVRVWRVEPSQVPVFEGDVTIGSVTPPVPRFSGEVELAEAPAARLINSSSSEEM